MHVFIIGIFLNSLCLRIDGKELNLLTNTYKLPSTKNHYCNLLPNCGLSLQQFKVRTLSVFTFDKKFRSSASTSGSATRFPLNPNISICCISVIYVLGLGYRVGFFFKFQGTCIQFTHKSFLLTYFKLKYRVLRFFNSSKICLQKKHVSKYV